jgi:membrane-associated HD superfamily phosphohydrolase
MSRLMIALLVTAGLGYAGVNAAQTYTPKTQTYAPKPTLATAALTKEGYAQAKKDADSQYKVDKEACASLSGNAKDICMAEAKGKDDVARAEAAAAYENTPKTRENARIAHAEATYKVNVEKCDDLAGNKKDVCVKEAKASLVRAKADAKVDRVALDTRKDSASKQSEAVKEANEDKRDADYKVAIEKCDALAGPAKDACIGNAKVQFGKS